MNKTHLNIGLYVIFSKKMDRRMWGLISLTYVSAITAKDALNDILVERIVK